MTVKRYELVFQGQLSRDGPWTDYRWRYKPGNAGSTQPLLTHFPRIEWRSWFAVLRREPWVYVLLDGLRRGEHDAVQAFAADPFSGRKPERTRCVIRGTRVPRSCFRPCVALTHLRAALNMSRVAGEWEAEEVGVVYGPVGAPAS